MDIRDTAIVLIILRVLSVVFLLLVVRRQIRLIKANNPSDVQTTRIGLFALALTLLVGNIIPLIINIYSLCHGILVTHPSLPNELYSYSNAITAAIASGTFWLLYRLVEQEITSSQQDNQDLQDENAQLKEDVEIAKNGNNK